MRADVSRWARECLACQQAKVTRHVVPPIGDFAVPNKHFDHINVDLVTLPHSNGFCYLLTRDGGDASGNGGERAGGAIF